MCSWSKSVTKLNLKVSETSMYRNWYISLLGTSGTVPLGLEMKNGIIENYVCKVVFA